MPPDGAGGRGHFNTVAEMRAAVEDHEKRLRDVERDLLDLTDLVMKPRRRRKRRTRSVMKP
jgi:hypothetical protein